MRDYQAAIATMFERSIADVAAQLREPDREHRGNDARRIVAMLVETLAGFAIGIVARDLARATNAWFGAELAALVHAAVPSPKRVPRAAATVEDAIDTPLRPTRDCLCDQLRARLGLAGAELAAMIEALAAKLPSDRKRASDAMFGELARGAEYDDRLARELSIGWACACAAIEHMPMPVIESSPRSRDLWRIWSELAGNPAPSETRQGVAREGYIALVG